jgi:hypothetical protein
MTVPVLGRPIRIAVSYYSATGNVHAMAGGIAEGSALEGADVRLRHVAELSDEMLISQNQYWGRHRSEVTDEPVAQLEIWGGPTGSRSGRRPASATSPRS